MSFFLATPRNEDAWFHTHRQRHVAQPNAGGTAPWLSLNSLPGGQRRVVMDNLSQARVFHRGYANKTIKVSILQHSFHLLAIMMRNHDLCPKTEHEPVTLMCRLASRFGFGVRLVLAGLPRHA